METVLQCSPLEGSLEVNTNTLPFGKDWLYSPIQSFLDHMKDDEDADAERGLQFMKDSLNMLVSLEEQRLECKLLSQPLSDISFVYNETQTQVFAVDEPLLSGQ